MAAQVLNLDNIFDLDNSFWTKYEKGRPIVPDSFFGRILEYHRQHGGAFGVVHDAGAGPGVHTTRISEPFSKVLVSDAGEQNVEAARMRLKNLDKDVICHAAKLEDASWVEPEGVDLVFAASCMHLVDLDQATRAFDRQLKRGGTLAIACMGYPAFEDERIQNLWIEMFRTALDKRLVQPRLENKAGLAGLTTIANAYDPVPLPMSVFKESALRYKINLPDDWWYQMHVCPGRENAIQRESQVGESEKMLTGDEEGWSFEVTLEGMKEQAATFPIWGDEYEQEVYWDRIEEIVRDRTVRGKWPHVLILATKRS